ncbi:MAG TPA: TetR family transcriptional regulator [Pseudolysinimonas sp.]|nr:TetR family transcriptional regulator [Pseudolysinimonas sp.]
MPDTPVRRVRRSDPDRRERIVTVATQIVARDGLDALTHRAVAAEADVQVGSTTYYFPTKEDLISAVIENAVRKGPGMLGEQLEAFNASVDLPGALTRVLTELVTNQFDQTLVDYEIHAAVRRRPTLSALVTRWPNIEYDAIVKYTDPETAKFLGDLFEGLLVQFVLYGHEFRADAVRRAFDRAVRAGELSQIEEAGSR